jgi:hypothetical protein
MARKQENFQPLLFLLLVWKFTNIKTLLDLKTTTYKTRYDYNLTIMKSPKKINFASSSV